MNELERRLASLTPKQRRLLELRLERSGAAGGDRRPASGGAAPDAVPAAPWPPERPVAMSLFFFSADGSSTAGDKYRLLLDVARAGDRAGFAGVWTPERHFQDFGGLYPNPSVVGAALAAVTERIQIRAGSVVLPLHHPVRVAEEWAVVDNLSGGRAAISVASGWHPSDFVLRPEAYAERKEVMFSALETVRRLWAGETLELPGGDGETYPARALPRPVQAELPVWVTSSGSPETWRRAGEVGAHVLASMGSQPIGDLAAKIAAYRAARATAGHDPAAGVVSLMLHAYLDDDRERAAALCREPLTDYLRTHMRQRDSFMELPQGITEADREALLPLAFDHYAREASLIGTPESVRPMVARLAAIGVDDLACLVDFGLPREAVLASLERLAEVRRAAAAAAPAEASR